MSPSRFPYPMVLVSLHMSCGSLLSCGLYMAMPTLFTALTDPDKKVAVDATFLWSRVLPVGLAFATSLICSNVAYEYASVPFLQMVKQSNVIIVFFLSLLAGLEQFRSNLALVLLCIVVATAFTVNGELRFSLTGWGMLTGVVLLGSFNHWHAAQFAAIPSLETFQQCNVAVAFLLNVITANFLKHGSPLSLLLTNLIKDAFIVVAGCAIFSDPISIEQGFAFVAQLFFIFLWSMMKAFPDVFEKEGLWQGISSLLVCQQLPGQFP
ncbi:unnamed protein product [Durusdinium trenchii]|uniref:Sugar phosphate transporter domain-containing protein n=1 Tax=Durusdinium trenchii TaxID=1381693 RepID=A0ABP0M9R7_9DINO